jgi:hypothetical protein
MEFDTDISEPLAPCPKYCSHGHLLLKLVALITQSKKLIFVNIQNEFVKIILLRIIGCRTKPLRGRNKGWCEAPFF